VARPVIAWGVVGLSLWRYGGKGVGEAGRGGGAGEDRRLELGGDEGAVVVRPVAVAADLRARAVVGHRRGCTRVYELYGSK
jgi:hypothetical protein